MAAGQVSAEALAALEEVPHVTGQAPSGQAPETEATPGNGGQVEEAAATSVKGGQVVDEADEDSLDETQAEGLPTRAPEGKGQAFQQGGQEATGPLSSDSMASVPSH